MKIYINNKLYISIITIAIFALLVSCISAPSDDHNIYTSDISPDTTVEPTDTIIENSTPLETVSIDLYTEIVIGSVGDIMCHQQMLKDAQNAAEGDWSFTVNGDEAYSFDHWFQFIKPYTEYPDLMIANLETTITLDNSLASGYPFFATPKEILPALSRAGFDVLVNGNNHILDKEQEGLLSTIQALNDADIYHTGAWASIEDKNTPLIIDVKGVLVGIISATCSVNGQDVHLTEEEKEYMYTYTDDLTDIAHQINNCKDAGAEVIVVCPHWGFENDKKAHLFVRRLGEEYIKLGADIILAHHSHILQSVEELSVELDNGDMKTGIVFWSLGNFISNQMYDMEYLSGAIAYVTIRKNNSSGEIEIVSSSYVPTWTYIQYFNETDSKTYSILPIGEVLDNPNLISNINPGNINNSLENAWSLITTRMNDTVSHPLRLVPDESSDTTY